jgi:hypothetical protein
LSEAEQVTLSLVFHDFFYGAAYSYGSAASAGSGHVETGDVEYLVKLLSENSSARDEWLRMKGNVEKMGYDFVSRVDKALAEGRLTTDPA